MEAQALSEGKGTRERLSDHSLLETFVAYRLGSLGFITLLNRPFLAQSILDVAVIRGSSLLAFGAGFIKILTEV